MLKEIKCDKFINKNNPEGAILFHDGLNVVLGTDNGNSSIGKSSLLMIIDFIFGGSDYVTIKELSDIVDHVGAHEFKFVFEFPNEIYYFKRNTTNSSFITLCDKEFKRKEDWFINDYLEFLKTKYELEDLDIGFREIVSRSIRIDRKNTLNSNTPLQNDQGDNKRDSIIALSKMFNSYNAVKELKKKLDEIDYKLTELKTDHDYPFIKFASSKKEIKHNESRMEELSYQMNIIENDNSSKLQSVVSANNSEITLLNHRLAVLRTLADMTNNRIRMIESDQLNQSRLNEKDLENLKFFFPAANIKAIEQIQEFHQKITLIMSKEKEDGIETNKMKLSIIKRQIDSINSKLKILSRDVKEENIPDAVFKRYAALSTEYNNLKAANKIAERENLLNESRKKVNEDYTKEFELQINKIKCELNKTMKEISETINHDHASPTIDISSSNYSFRTVGDHSSDVDMQGLVIFDLALLKLTKLPIVIHDTNLINYFNTSSLEKLMEVYNSFTSKQIFIAIEKQSALSLRTQKMLKEKVVYKLDLNNRLYNENWTHTK